MCKTFTQCKTWEEILDVMVHLTNENERLKAEKSQLVNELINLRLHMKQIEKRKEHVYKIRISEMERR